MEIFPLVLKYKWHYLLLLILAGLLSSCSPTRRIPEGQHLLNRNRIKIDEGEVDRARLQNLVQQKPNRRILGFYRFHLNVYQFADRGKEGRIRRWMKNTIGEPPVLYDPVLAQNTARQFELYLHAKGYFNNEVDYAVKYRGKKATVHYSLTGHRPYLVNDLQYRIDDSYLAGFVYADTLGSLIKRGGQYDADLLQKERERLTRHLRNSGYFYFSRDFITYQVDSALGTHRLNLEMQVNNPVQAFGARRDSLVVQRHRRFRVDQVLVFPEHSPFQANPIPADTTVYLRRSIHDGQYYPYIFLHHEPLRIKPTVISNHILFRPGAYYRIRDAEQTYNFLAGLRNFRSINLQYHERQPSGADGDSLGHMNVVVQLSRNPANAFTIEAEGLNSSGNLGVAGNVVYQNRNIFRGAEIFNLRLKAAVEVSGESGLEDVFLNLPFNTLELGAEAGVDFPRLLLPLAMQRLSRNARPKSTVLAGINYRRRPDYTRYLANMSYGFEWFETPQKKHFVYPLEISSIRVYNDSLLRANIPEGNPLLLSRFRDHLILGLKHSYVYNTQQVGRLGDFYYLRTNFESAGNLLQLTARSLEFPMNESGSYTVFKIPFAQYLKGDVDFRYYRVYSPAQSMVFRVMGGLGVPYGNLNVLPFIKSYYGGGANGIRAWRIFGLGPGGYAHEAQNTFDRYGDVKLEANLEYRFRYHSFWHGAFFLDAGNVWFLNKNEQFPGGEFRLGALYHDLALGGGTGLRLDFDFFVIRMDVAVPLKNPARPAASQWISSWPRFSQLNFNLGIGYPF